MKAITVANLFFRRFGAAALVAFMAVTAAGTQVQAQTQVAPPAVALPDFTGIVEKVEPAVVNIRTTATVPVRGSSLDTSSVICTGTVAVCMCITGA